MLIGTCCSGSSTRVAVTTTASSNAASRKPMAASSSGSFSTSTPSTVACPKPLRKTVNVYTPGGTPVNVNRPARSDTADRTPAGSPASVTVAPGSTAPVASTTVPLTCPPCAAAGAGPTMTRQTKTANVTTYRSMEPLVRKQVPVCPSRTGIGVPRARF